MDGFGHDQTDRGERAAKKPRVELSARERFLQELARFASDDEDNDEVMGSNRGDSQQPTSASAAVGSGAAPARSMLFGQDEEGGDGLEGGCVALKPEEGPQQQVGLALLRNMHDSLTDAGPPTAMRKVEAYVPLSSGGFLDADAEHGDLRSVKVGDVLVCLKPPHAGASGAGSGGGSKPASPATPSPSSEKAYSSPTSTAPAVPPAAVIAAASSRKIMTHFRAEASLTEEEKQYGKKPTAEMAAQLITVARLDRATGTIEGVFLDGSRAKLRLYDVRPAGFVERMLFHKWKVDPSSRPVKAVGADSVAAPAGTLTAAATSDVHTEPPWWVLPNLLVRVVASDAGDWYGRKGVVVAVRRKESAVRLMALDAWAAAQRQHGASSSSPSSSRTTCQTHDCIDIHGLARLETVLPKKGESGMIVLGDFKGDMGTVTARLRGEDGDLAALEVKCHRTGDLLRLQPHELCALARQ